MLAIAVMIISQIIIPPFINRRFFWLFRKSERKLMKAEASLEDSGVIETATELELEQARRLRRTRMLHVKASKTKKGGTSGKHNK
jgi:hypothetical protein